MAGPIPSVPANFIAQPASSGSVYLSWSTVASATSYNILRSGDGVNYSTIASSTGVSFYDTSPLINTLYYYEVQSVNSNGTSNAAAPQVITPVNIGQVSLGQIRLAAQQRCDMVNDNFITTQEWNSYISHSYTELYDLLVAVYADEYYVAVPYQFQTDNRNPALYPLPNNLYKLMGVELSIGGAPNGWVTLRKFTFLSRNKYPLTNSPVNFRSVFGLQYRVVGTNLEFSPFPQANQTVQIWYVPRPNTLVADSDILDGISGWDEYVVVDAAIKALQKQEDDVSVLIAQKMDLRKRIENMASNRDAGEPEGVTDIRRMDGYGDDGFWGGNSGGY